MSEDPHAATEKIRTTEEIESLYRVGLRLMQYRRYEDARSVFSEAITLRPSDPQAYKARRLFGAIPYNLGYAELLLGNDQRAVELFHLSIKRAPGNFLAFAALKDIHRKNKDRVNLFKVCLLWWKNWPFLFASLYRYNYRVISDEETYRERTR